MAEHGALTEELLKFLDDMGRQTRKFARRFGEVGLSILTVNNDLPDGRSPIPSLDMMRRLPAIQPEIEVREFKMLVGESGQQIGEEGALPAKRRSDGKFDVSVQKGSWRDGAPIFETLICELADWVEITTTTRAPYYASGPLFSEIAVPASRDGDPPWWRPMDAPDGMIHPSELQREVDRVEGLALGSGLNERTEVKRMSAAQWRELQSKKVA